MDFKQNIIDRKILGDLYSSVNGLFAFTFYSRYKIEPENMFYFIDKYSEKGIIIYEDDKLYLTKEGRSFYLKQLFHKPSPTNIYSNIPVEFIIRKLEINEPYLPNINSI